MHHLRPEDVTVNSTRGNKDFDNGGSAVAEAPGNCTDADSFEPRDAVKGDVARMILYMAVRYEGDDGWPNLELNNSVNNGSAPVHRQAVRAAGSGTGRTRRTPSRSAATSSSTTATSTTGTRSSTTRSGPTRSGTDTVPRPGRVVGGWGGA